MEDPLVDKLNQIGSGSTAKGATGQSLIDQLNAIGNSGIPNRDQYHKTSDLDEGLLLDMDQNEYRARNQSAGRLFKNAAARGLSEVILGTLEGASYLTDVEELSNLADGSEEEFGNWFGDLMKQGQEAIKDAAPIYVTKEGKGFAPNDATWWASNAESIASTLSLLIPTAAVVKGASIAGKAMGLGRAMTSRIGRDVAKGVVGGMTSRRMENTMEASGVFDQTYQLALNEETAKGTPEETAKFNAKQKAGEAARNDWYANNVNLVTDIAQQMMLLRGGKGFGFGVKTAAQAGKAAKPTIGSVAKQMGAEGFEEANQSVIGEEAKNAALSTEFDFFGKGFQSRVIDYLGDPQLHTAAFFGALGGGAFGGAGPLIMDKINGFADKYRPSAERLRDEALAKARAETIGDIDKVNVLSDINFGRLAFAHLDKGNTDTLRDNLVDLKEDPKADEKSRRRIDQYLEDLDFIEERHFALSDDTRIPQDMVRPVVGLELEHKMRSRALKESSEDISSYITELTKNGEISSEVATMKYLQLVADAYNKLAVDAQVPAFAGKAAEEFSAFQDMLKAWDKANPGKYYSHESAAADKLAPKVYNNVSIKEKLEHIRKDLNEFYSPGGIQRFTAKARAERQLRGEQAILNNPEATIEQLQSVLSSQEPIHKQAAEQRLAAAKDAKKEVNKDKVETAKSKKKEKTEAQKRTTAPATKEQKDKLDKFNKEAAPGVTIPPVVVPPVNVPTPKATDVPTTAPVQVDDTTDTPETSTNMGDPLSKDDLLGNRIQVESTKPLQVEPPELEGVSYDSEPSEEATRVSNELVQEATDSMTASIIADAKKGAKTVLKELAGDWVKQEDGTTVFVKILNPDTTPKTQDYWFAEDQTHSNPVSVYEVFDAKTVNSPLVKEGDEVIIKHEPQWAYWKSNNPEDTVYNVYRSVGGKATGLPIAQIPSSKKDKQGNYPKTSTAESRALRTKLSGLLSGKKKSVKTTISYKNVGDAINLRNSDGSKVTNSLEVLETDFVDTKEQKTSHNPILAYVDSQSFIQVPWAELMKGNPDLASVNEMQKETGAGPGTILVLRRNPKGGFTPLQIDPRKINEEELSWLKDNLATTLSEKNYEDLKTLIHIENADITDNISMYNNSNRLVNYAGDIAFQVPRTNDSGSFWVKINATGKYGKNFANFMAGEAFNFQVYKTDGTKYKELQHSDSIDPALFARIKEAFETTLKTQFKNIDKNFINSESKFTDVLGKTYNSYYDYIKTTNSATTDLPKGFSFYNASIYLDPSLKAGGREVTDTKQIGEAPKSVVQPAVIIPTPTTPGKQEKRKINWDDVDEDLNRRYRLAKPTGTFKVIGDRELNWMKDKFSQDGYLSIAQGVDRVIYDGGIEAFGSYHNAMIELAQFSEEGSGYHEAFHFIFDVALSDAQQDKIMALAKKRFKTNSAIETEEALAEDFRAYMLSDGKYKPAVEASRSLFRRILDYIKQALGLKDSIERLFEDIANLRMITDKSSRQYQEKFSNRGEWRYRLVPGFSKVNQQKEAIQASAHYLIQMATEDAGDKASFDELLTREGNLDRYLETLHFRYQKSLKEINELKNDISSGDVEASEQEIAEIKVAGATLKAILTSWSDTKSGDNIILGFKSELVKSLNKYGFSVKEVSRDLEAEDMDFISADIKETVEAESKERIHGISFLLNSPRSSLSVAVKRFLTSVAEYEKNADGTIKRDSEGKPVIAQTIFHTPKFIEFNRVYSNLKSKLSNSKDVYARLTDLAEEDALIAAVKDSLDERIQKAGESQDPFVAQFFTTFTSARYKLFTTLLGYENGVPTAKAINTDRRNQEDTIIADWETNAIKRGLMDSAEKVNEDKVKGLSKAMDDLLAKRETITYEELRERFEKALHVVGIDLPAQVLAKIDRRKTKRTILQRLIYGPDAPSLEAFINRAQKGDNPFFETGMVMELAKLAKDYMEDISASTFMNEANNQVSAINLGSAITDEIQRLKDGDEGKAHIRKLQNDPFYRGNRFLEQIYTDAGQKTFEVKFFSAFREGKFSSPKEQDETNVQESLFSRLAAYHNGNNASGYIYLGTLADKGQIVAALLPKKKGQQARTLLHETLRNTVNQEITRIQRLNSGLVSEDGTMSLNDINNFKDANKFLYIPGLNAIEGLANGIKDGSLDLDKLDVYEEQINKVIADFISNEEKIFFQKLESYKLIEVKEKSIKNLGLPEAVVAGSVRNNLTNFFMNDMMWRLEMSKVFHGDIAFYKNADQYFKRGYQIITPGISGYINPGLKAAAKLKAYNRGIFASSMKVNSPEYLTGLAKLIDKKVTQEQIEQAISDSIVAGRLVETDSRAVNIALNYTTIYNRDGVPVKGSGVNKTDAQTYSTIDAHRDLMKRFGFWSNDHQFLYDIAWKEGKSVKSTIHFAPMSQEARAYWLGLEGKTLLQPLKTFTFGNRFVTLSDGSTLVLKEQYKESVTVLLPEFANKHTQLKELLEAMTRDNIHLMSDAEAVKVGQYRVNHDLSQPIVSRQVPAENLRLPLVIPAKEKSMIKAGTQIEKLIVGNIDPETTYVVDGKAVKGNKLVQDFHNTWSEIIKQDYDALKTMLHIDDSLKLPEADKLTFLKKFKAIIEEELGSRELPDNYSDALMIVRDKLNRPSFNVDIDFPALGTKYEQVITNLWKKYVINQKLPGDSLVNMADFGTPKYENSSELKFITNNKGEIQAAEVAMPFRFGEKLGIDEKNIDPISNKIIWDSLTPEQQKRLEIIIYRIPTSDKNSMLPCRIAMILPRSMGSTIMVPGEGTKQGGFDFDVDKSNVMWRSSGKESRTALHNKLFDIHWAVLTNTAHAEELLKPIDAVVHDEMIAYLKHKGVLNKEIANSPFSVVTDLEMEKRNKYAAAMIGIFAKYAVGHATLQTIKDQVSISVPIDIEVEGYKFDEVGRIRDNRGELISANHSAMEQSALDNAKDPKLDYLNITTFNAETLAYMTDLGVNQKLALAFMNQPIIKELAEEYFRSGDNDFEGSIDLLKKKYNGLSAMMGQASKKRIATISPRSLDNGLTIMNIDKNLEHQAQVLSDFRAYFYAAKDMSLLNTVLSTDTISDMTGIAAVESFLNIRDHVSSEDSAVQVPSDIFDIETTKIGRIAAFMKYGVEAAYGFTGQFYPYSSSPFRTIKSQIAKDTGKKNGMIVDKDMIGMINKAMSMVMLTENGYIGKILGRYSPNFTERFSYWSPKESMVLYKDKILKQFPRLEKNLLMQALKPDIYNDKAEAQLLVINNTHGNFDKTNLTNSWWELLTDSDEDVKLFAHDLIRFAIATTGFRMTPVGFIDLVPVQFWNESGIASYYSGLSTSYQAGAKTVNPIDLSKVVIRNNFTYKALVPTLTVGYDKDNNVVGLGKFERANPKGTHITSFMAPKDKRYFNDTTKEWVRFIKSYDRKAGQWRLYESSGGPVFVEIQPLGDPGRYTQYTWDADATSSNPEHKNIQSHTKLKLSDVDRESMESIGMTTQQFKDTIAAYEVYGIEYDKIISAQGVLEKMAEMETDVEYKELINNLLRHKDRIQDLSISTSNELPDGDRAWIDISTFAIEINERRHTTEPTLRRTLLHEMIHAFSARVTAFPETEQERLFSINVKRHMLEAQKKIKGAPHYGFTNPAEFIAEIGSRREFRDAVRGVPTLWQKIIRAFRKLFGMKDTDVYNRIFNDLYTLLDQAPELRVDKGAQRKWALIDPLTDAQLLAREANQKEGKPEKITSTKILVSKLKKALEDRMSQLKSRNKDWRSIEKLLIQIEKLSDQQGIVKFVQNSLDEIAETSGEINKLLGTPEKLSSAKIVHAQQRIGAYNILKDIKKHIRAHADEFKDIKMGDKSLLGVVENQIVRLANLQEDLLAVGKDIIAKFIKNNTSEDTTEEYIRGQLDLADRDISIVNRALDAIINSRDVVLRTLGKLVTNGKAKAYRLSEAYLKNQLTETVKNYQEWAKYNGIDSSNMMELNKPILDDVSFEPKSTGIYFADPESSKGKAILARGKDDPLRKYYENVVLAYLKKQESIPKFMRPGLRVPSIRKSSLELITDEKGLDKFLAFKEAAIDTIRKTYDESDRKSVDQDGNPIEWIPVRYISKQDGKEGRMSRKEVSLDVASTVFMFIDEMNNYDQMNDIIYELELAKDIVRKREVALTKRKAGFGGLLSPDRVTVIDGEGNVVTKAGETSEAYKQLDTFMRRMVFGQTKKDEGDINILGIKADVGKVADALTRYTGVRIMAGNLNIAFSNVATGEVTMLKEAIGGRWFNMKDWWAGKKSFFKEVVPYMGEWGKRRPTSKFGVVFEFINPEDSSHGNPQLSKGDTRFKQVAKWKTLGLPNTIGNMEMQGSLMMAIMNTERFTAPDGKTVGLYEALDTSSGLPKIKTGYKYNKNKGVFGEAEMDKVRNKIVRLGQDINGIYNVIDSSGIRETAIGRMVLVMRGWLKAGIDARWRLQFYNERLEGQDEGYYISAINFFKNMFGPEGWMKKEAANLKYLIGRGLKTDDLLSEEEKKKLSQDEQENLASLRRANIKKFLFEMYVIAGLTALAMLGWDDDDDRDSFALYHIIRLRRELTTYFSPTTAWDVLRSPTVALDTIEKSSEFIWGVVSAPVLLLQGKELPEYEQGGNKNEKKIWVQIKNKVPVWSQRHQFEDFDKRIDLIERGWK